VTPTHAQVVLEVSALSVGYGDLLVFRDVSFEVPVDGCVAVPRPNGLERRR
jgi:ABC-type branched-subunit amino acid transport system ATPase component